MHRVMLLVVVLSVVLQFATRDKRAVAALAINRVIERRSGRRHEGAVRFGLPRHGGARERSARRQSISDAVAPRARARRRRRPNGVRPRRKSGRCPRTRTGVGALHPCRNLQGASRRDRRRARAYTVAPAVFVEQHSSAPALRRRRVHRTAGSYVQERRRGRWGQQRGTGTRPGSNARQEQCRAHARPWRRRCRPLQRWRSFSGRSTSIRTRSSSHSCLQWAIRNPCTSSRTPMLVVAAGTTHGSGKPISAVRKN